MPRRMTGPDDWQEHAFRPSPVARHYNKRLAPKPPDILHCPSFVMPWAVRVPMVVTVHDAASRRFPGDHPLEWRVYVDAFMPRRLRAATRVITGSEFGRREVIEAFGVDPDRVVTVPYGLDARFLEYFRVERAQVKPKGVVLAQHDGMRNRP